MSVGSLNSWPMPEFVRLHFYLGITNNEKLESSYVSFFIFLGSILALFAYHTLYLIEAPSGGGVALGVIAIGHQWYWSYEYKAQCYEVSDPYQKRKLHNSAKYLGGSSQLFEKDGRGADVGGRTFLRYGFDSYAVGRGEEDEVELVVDLSIVRWIKAGYVEMRYPYMNSCLDIIYDWAFKGFFVKDSEVRGMGVDVFSSCYLSYEY